MLFCDNLFLGKAVPLPFYLFFSKLEIVTLGEPMIPIALQEVAKNPENWK